MSELLALLLRASLWLLVAMLLVALLRPLLLRLGGAVLAYRSWCLLPIVLLALALPAPQLAEMVAVPALLMPGLGRGPSAASAGAQAGWSYVLLAAWAAGALLAAARGWRAQQRFMRALGPLVKRQDGSWQASADPGLPALVGLWRPRIVVGPDFDLRFTPAEQDMVLQHERHHRRQGDHWANGGLLLLRCLFWFHPLMPWAARRFLQDQELACDARTLDPHPALRRLYASALLKAQLAHPVAPMACHWRCQPLLKERIAMLKQSERKPLFRITGKLLVVTLCAIVGTAAWASQGAAPPAAGSQQVQVRNMSAPAYPSGAFEQGQTGVVTVQVDVDAQGQVRDVRVVSATNPGIFEEATLAAARQWTFEPAMKDGRPVPAAVRVPVTFALDDDRGTRINAD